MTVAEALRRQHCERAGRQHECVGRMVITAAGIELSCGLCGSTEEPWVPRATREAARRILSAAGVDIDCLSPSARAAVEQRVLAAQLEERP